MVAFLAYFIWGRKLKAVKLAVFCISYTKLYHTCCRCCRYQSVSTLCCRIERFDLDS